MRKSLLLLSLLVACTSVDAQNSWKPVKKASVATEVDASATVLRVITKWTVPSGSDSVRVNVSFDNQPPQIKQYLPTRTTDTSSFNLIAGESATGGSIITAVKIGRVLTPVVVNFGPFNGSPLPPQPNWPGVTGATATGDTL